MAARKKGLSLEEKRAQMLALFYETEDVFQMKELEKIAPKQKGVIPQAVKEVTQSLVDDGLVECEKIGTFVCYWAFRSKASQIRKRKLQELDESINDMKKKIAEGSAELKKQRKGKEDSEERTELLNSFANLQEEEKTLSEQLAQYAEYDPEAIAQVKLRTEKTREDANRWTDNIFSIKKWCKTKFGMDEKILDQQFDIPEDMDYIE
ncbi:Meiotic nuclear division protein 1 [Parelaphostrongylus tenuis]|uniref:Meiotic nuclear division protein 1 homolog n=1 Tax=Parelaphostrongylus tenuis TaxID=148309 RepID=A0AAD5MN76_PARTN|nr:Meiotic nuclear division protein 1 [Parelaphostrongylus tenuis]